MPATSPTVLVIGDANPDLLLTGDVVPRFGQAEQAVDAALALGGSGAIMAAALARLDVRVALAAAVGDDELGAITVARLVALGVDTSAIQRGASGTGLSVHLLHDDDRAILTRVGAIAELDLDAACAAIPGVRHVHLAGIFLAAPLVAGGAQVVAAARAAGATVSADTNADPSGDFAVPSWLLDVDVLLPNAAEALALTGEVSVEAAARALSRRGATVAVKLGADGALAVHGDQVARCPPFAVGAVVDAVGAGDAFDAGFVRAQLDGRALGDALALGCATGALSLRERGERGQPTLSEALTLAGLPA